MHNQLQLSSILTLIVSAHSFSVPTPKCIRQPECAYGCGSTTKTSNLRHFHLQMTSSSGDGDDENMEEPQNINPPPQMEIETETEKPMEPSYAELEEISMTKEQLDREVKKYKLQQEIDSIVNDPEGPFDIKSELKKVTGGISPPLMTNPEVSIEEDLQKTETEMYDAVEAGDYDLAQSKKDELNKMHIDDCCSVLQANSAFYRAFSNKDYEAMENLWLPDASALCIHPSSQALIGAKNVLNSFKEMFSGGNDAFQKNKMEPSNLRIAVKGTTAIVTCDEEVYTKRFVRGKKRDAKNKNDAKNGMELVNKLITTNIFRKVSGNWYMVHHHATWHSESDAAKKALEAQMGSSSKDSDDDDSGITVEGMLGIPGHEGLGGSKKDENDEKGGAVRRIFTGSLSDLLGSGLLGGDDDDDDASSGMGLGGSVGGGNLFGSGNSKSIIIRAPSSDDGGKSEEEALEDEDDDDNDDVIDLNANGLNVVNGNNGVNGINGDKKEKEVSKRQKCITSLRKLAKEGSISAKQKRMLLTEIIVRSAANEVSMVEVAHEVLCGQESDDEEAEEAEEDFAEQCKVFASSLSEAPINTQPYAL